MAILSRQQAAGRGQRRIVIDDRDFGQWLDAFRLEKALYELGYELASRPAWISIPLPGTLRILNVPTGRQGEG